MTTHPFAAYRLRPRRPAEPADDELDVVERVVCTAGSAELARDLLEVVADWSEVST